MPWSPVSPMDQKKQLVHDYFRGVLTVAELSDRYGVSPKTIYKWVARFELDGARGLANRSRRPHGSPQQTPKRLVDAILELQIRRGVVNGVSAEDEKQIDIAGVEVGNQ